LFKNPLEEVSFISYDKKERMDQRSDAKLKLQDQVSACMMSDHTDRPTNVSLRNLPVFGRKAHFWSIKITQNYSINTV
jgi:hypothetical protein